ncbi:MAG TPA: hypothetical protein VND93_01875 [Myxococcales bacterium]|nr:hypothetical protein [Myxococcales bacterium]
MTPFSPPATVRTAPAPTPEQLEQTLQAAREALARLRATLARPGQVRAPAR